MRLIDLFADGVLLKHEEPRRAGAVVNAISVADANGTPRLYMNAFFANWEEERALNTYLQSFGFSFERQGEMNMHGLLLEGGEAQMALDLLHHANTFTDEFYTERPIIYDDMYQTASRYLSKARYGFGDTFILPACRYMQ